MVVHFCSYTLVDEYKGEVQALRSTLKQSSLEVNEDLKDKRNAENLCK
jgi:hypothetical protein